MKMTIETSNQHCWSIKQTDIHFHMADKPTPTKSAVEPLAIATDTLHIDAPHATPVQASGRSAHYFRNCCIAFAAFIVLSVGGTMIWYMCSDPVEAFSEPPPAYNVSACQACSQLGYIDMRPSKYRRYNGVEDICPSSLFPGDNVEWLPMKPISSSCCCPLTVPSREASDYYYRIDYPYTFNATTSGNCTCKYKYSSKSDMGSTRGWTMVFAICGILIVIVVWWCMVGCHMMLCRK
ncbi:hypothetical protein DYB37_009741 [Aphanomyces astaci]|uniref:Uncharacterized protein n=1 Tax=Aphanomyces astaci TaxID=112090 RepID=A0A397ARH9_APHAT|nr:hypothetical protein DYB25_000278 [Aphanomyces astaci]RHY10493.1 hypothetical protein DYB36_002757 [Aphanomyces astaci]RHY44248.1 hypothetical protein DYB34_014089 [Aphanomyces astaci]RHY51802.1 hypothetical protein DYB38_010139 [Aphanomyces astaci]RHY79502.1 hypothetical protein DYB30_009339 [Aphanomyces astaci]